VILREMAVRTIVLKLETQLVVRHILDKGGN